MNYRILLESYRDYARANHDYEMIQFADLFINYERSRDEGLAAKLIRHPRGNEAADWIDAKIRQTKENIAGSGGAT